MTLGMQGRQPGAKRRMQRRSRRRLDQHLGAGLAAQAGMVGPLSTILMGVWLLGEPFTVWVAAGTALVMAGVALLARVR
jgi:drug/metabolite transporter (DMT)-like permease